MTVQINDNGNIEKLLEMLPDVVDTFRTAAAIRDNTLIAQWYDLQTCFELRGGGAFSTFKSNRWYQPKGGIPDAVVQGRHVWSRETVAEWLTCTDKDLAEYHQKYLTGAKSPHREKEK